MLWFLGKWIESGVCVQGLVTVNSIRIMSRGHDKRWTKHQHSVYCKRRKVVTGNFGARGILVQGETWGALLLRRTIDEQDSAINTHGATMNALERCPNSAFDNR